MPEVTVRKSDGAEAGKVKLDSHLFEAPVNQAVMHQAFVRQMANARQGSANTRTRTEVRGGGRKPYRQKGTGRARQGSIRAPQYAGGGVVFGPKPRSYAQDMPRKQRRLALRSALSVKAQEDRVVVVDGTRAGGAAHARVRGPARRHRRQRRQRAGRSRTTTSTPRSRPATSPGSGSS